MACMFLGNCVEVIDASTCVMVWEGGLMWWVGAGPSSVAKLQSTRGLGVRSTPLLL